MRLALLAVCASAYVLPAAPRARDVRLHVLERDPVKLDVVVSSEIPARWRKLHDCERPARWREEILDDEDCRGYGEDDDDAAASRTEDPPPARASNYADVIGTITTVADFDAAAARSAESDSLFVLKFYSKTCRACLRIAAKYRRLALNYHGKIDCYEAELSASKALFRALDVQEVPSVQIFHGTLLGQDLTRLASSRCKPADFARVEAKIVTAYRGVQQKRDLMQTMCENRRNQRGLARHLWVRTHDDLYDNDGVLISPEAKNMTVL